MMKKTHYRSLRLLRKSSKWSQAMLLRCLLLLLTNGRVLLAPITITSVEKHVRCVNMGVLGREFDLLPVYVVF